MKLQPTSRYAQPGYPTRDILREHPELLRLVPERWRAHPLVLGVLAGTLSLLTACRQQAPASTPRGGAAPAAAPTAGPVLPAVTQPAAAGKSLVAPLFIHGEGQGSFGCMAINPPVFLGEAEARAVIRDEARKAGIEFAEDAVSISGVAAPITDTQSGWTESDQAKGEPRKRRTTQKLPLTLDGAEQRTGIGYEYVSQEDFSMWEDRDSSGYCSTVSSYDIRDAATELRHGLVVAAPTRALGVFYDPMARDALPRDTAKVEGADPAAAAAGLRGYERQAALKKRHAEELLRQQVRDFIAWLKAQGVI